MFRAYIIFVSLRRQRDEQVPTRSPIAKSQTIQTIHNYSIHNSKFNETGCTPNLLRGPGLQPRRKFTSLDPGNHGLPLSGHTSTGCFQSLRGRRSIATVFAAIQSPKHDHDMRLMEQVPTSIDTSPIRQTTRP